MIDGVVVVVVGVVVVVVVVDDGGGGGGDGVGGVGGVGGVVAVAVDSDNRGVFGRASRTDLSLRPTCYSSSPVCISFRWCAITFN